MAYAGPASRGARASKSNPAMELIDARRTAAPLPTRRRQLTASVADDGERTSVFVAGLAMGLAIGAGAALLFAPQSGSDTRHSIKRVAKRAGRRLGRRGNDAWEDLRDELSRFRRYRRNSRNRREASSL